MSTRRRSTPNETQRDNDERFDAFKEDVLNLLREQIPAFGASVIDRTDAQEEKISEMQQQLTSQQRQLQAQTKEAQAYAKKVEEKLRNEATKQSRNLEKTQAEVRCNASPLSVQYNNQLRRDHILAVLHNGFIVEDVNEVITALLALANDNENDNVKLMDLVSKLMSVKTEAEKEKFIQEAMVCWIEESDAVNDPREHALKLRSKGGIECRLRLNELKSHKDEDMKIFKAWVKEWVKVAQKSCDNTRLVQAQNKKRPFNKNDDHQGPSKKNRGNKGQHTSAATSSDTAPPEFQDEN